MKTRWAACAATLLSACLGACADLKPVHPMASPPDNTLSLVQPVRARGQGGGVFVADNAWSLHSDTRAFRVGDVLTVALDETTQASKRADTTFGKESSVGVTPTTIGSKILKTDISIGAKREFNGGSSSTQQNALSGAITVIVHEVMPNGLLRVAGEKSLFLNQGEEFVRLAGFVRAADIDTDNRISSQRIANARIAYSGRGTLSDSNNAGWLMRFFASPLMPF